MSDVALQGNAKFADIHLRARLCLLPLQPGAQPLFPAKFQAEPFRRSCRVAQSLWGIRGRLTAALETGSYPSDSSATYPGLIFPFGFSALVPRSFGVCETTDSRETHRVQQGFSTQGGHHYIQPLLNWSLLCIGFEPTDRHWLGTGTTGPCGTMRSARSAFRMTATSIAS